MHIDLNEKTILDAAAIQVLAELRPALAAKIQGELAPVFSKTLKLVVEETLVKMATRAIQGEEYLNDREKADLEKRVRAELLVEPLPPIGGERELVVAHLRKAAGTHKGAEHVLSMLAEDIAAGAHVPTKNEGRDVLEVMLEKTTAPAAGSLGENGGAV